MPESGDSAAEIARLVAARLRHLARHRGVRYVPEGVSPQAREPATADVATRTKAPEPEVAATGAPSTSAAEWTATEKLAWLRERNVGDCRRCSLCRGRTNIVFGVGSADARVMFVGEGPGFHEDQQGEPFVGAAGKRLDEWIAAIGRQRADVYIANVVKCRPPDNRDPTPEEIKACAPFLHAQIRAIEPDVIVALGRFAASELTGSPTSLGRMRGRLHTYEEPKTGRRVPVIVLPHPAFVLRRDQQAQPVSDGKTENERAVKELRNALAEVEARAPA